MAQHDFVINNQGFPAFRQDLNDFLNAVRTTHSGTTRPSGAVSGTIWLDTTSSSAPTLKYYDGTDDISLATIDHTANTVNWLDSTVSITGLSTTATGTVLTLSDTATTSTVNLIIDNQKEVRFRETTGNGTNYIGLKAPASVSADLTFTLPATDGTNGQVLTTNGSGVLSFATPASGISWQSTVKTSGFTAVAGEGYFCNTTSSAFTVTLPASPTAGQQIALVDYAGTFDTNNLTINPNGNKIEGGTVNLLLTGEREGVLLVYIDSTQGWIPVSGINEGTDALEALALTVDYLVVAGGGGGGDFGAGGGGAGGMRTGTQTLVTATNYTATVGGGGTGARTISSVPSTGGSNSVFNTITSNGGGRGGDNLNGVGGNGGSGGGASRNASTSIGSGNTPSTSPSQGANGGTAYAPDPYLGGGGGGGGSSGSVGSNASGSVAGAGGAGTASSITGSSVTYAGGGGGGTGNGATSGSGGSGGGGNGGNASNTGFAGTANRGGGGGAGYSGDGGSSPAPCQGGNGGSGVVILKYPDAFTISNPAGGLTISTPSASGGYKVSTITAGTGNVQWNL